MSALLRIALRTIRRRIEAGEKLETIIATYPRMTESEKAEIQTELEKDNSLLG